MLPEDGVLRRIVLVSFAAVPLIFGGLALALGQDNNWDLRNYHWYDGYAALAGRLDVDMGAAQIPTFYNPTLDVVFFLLANALPAVVFSFFLGALQGCNFILLYLIAACTLRIGDDRLHVLACAVIALTAVIGGGHIGMVGTVFYDNIVSLLIFAAVIVVLGGANALEREPMPAALRRVLLAGLLVGLGVGLKLPTQIFAVGVCFGLLFVPGPPARRFMLALVCGLGVISGFALLGGWWMWELSSRYANPLFPYFNDVMRSPWALFASYRDDRFLAGTLAEALVLPFRLFVDGKAGGEIAFRDGRILGAYIVVLATPFMLLAARAKPVRATPASAPPPAVAMLTTGVFAARYLVAVAGLSYVAWLMVFGIYRYLVPLEMLAPLIVVVCLSFWPVARPRQWSLAIGLLGFMILTIQPGSWGRIPWSSGPWSMGLGGKFVDVTVPEVADPGSTLVLMTGFAPTAFVIPSFPPGVVFLRPQSYLVEPEHRTRFNAEMHARIAGHGGEIYLLQATWEKSAGERVLPQLGLQVDVDDCRPIRANLDSELELCALNRIAVAPQS